MTDLGSDLIVTVLGNRGAGKTVLLHLMNAQLGSEVGQPHSLRLVDVDDRLDPMVLQRLYKYGQWPRGTERTESFRFRLEHPDCKPLHVDWVDYRGADLYAKSNSPKASELTSRLKKSDAVICLLDIDEDLPVDSVRSRENSGLARIAAVCRNLIEGDSRPRSWVFVHSKADQVVDANGNTDWQACIRRIRAHVDQVPRTLTAGAATSFCYTAVSIGKNSRSDDEERVVLHEDPQFVELPLLFAVSDALLIRGEKADHNTRQREADLAAIKNRNWIVRVLLHLRGKTAEVEQSVDRARREWESIGNAAMALKGLELPEWVAYEPWVGPRETDSGQ